MPKVTTKAKRAAIAKAYGCPPVETDMDDFYYSRGKLAKVPDANEHGWHELKYQNEEADFARKPNIAPPRSLNFSAF